MTTDFLSGPVYLSKAVVVCPTLKTSLLLDCPGSKLFKNSEIFGVHKDFVVEQCERFVHLSAVFENGPVKLCSGHLDDPSREYLLFGGFSFYLESLSVFRYQNLHSDTTESALADLMCRMWQSLSLLQMASKKDFFHEDVSSPSVFPDLDMSMLLNTGFVGSGEVSSRLEAEVVLERVDSLREAIASSDIDRYSSCIRGLAHMGIAVLWGRNGKLELRNYRTNVRIFHSGVGRLFVVETWSRE